MLDWRASASSRPSESRLPRIVYTSHAEDRMRQRRISRVEVRLTLLRPAGSARLFDEPDKWEYRRQIGGRTVVVIVYREGNRFKVKAVYSS
ncbi:MAG: DUF4258 domain-containing protein [Nitrososphaerota archaeon]|nr:DUF4258 domain-containing protein [Nitrososphaerota archaeon]MDG7026145.1 DUF4258 domain-containing protein [Nitrososphaerota archaeon]